MFLRIAATLPILMFIFGIHSAAAQQNAGDILRTLDFRSGKITIGDELADIEQTGNYRYLNNANAQTFLTRIWGNPPGAGRNSLGMILPVDPNPLADDGWAIIVSYDPSGYVSDEEADKIDYDSLLKDMQEGTREESKRRIQQGQEAIELVGWAKRPFYDAKAKKMHWAKRLRFGDGGGGDTLNYNIRVLGRKGVLNLNVVASMSALESIERKIPEIMSMVHFRTGNTYAEYDPKIDVAATYGLAGLVAGGVLAKTGFFKGLIALLFASKKLVALAFFGGLALFWGKIKRAFSSPPAATAGSQGQSAPPTAAYVAEQPDAQSTGGVRLSKEPPP
jgi:uncharacterized membrane-anchored protein